MVYAKLSLVLEAVWFKRSDDDYSLFVHNGSFRNLLSLYMLMISSSLGIYGWDCKSQTFASTKIFHQRPRSIKILSRYRGSHFPKGLFLNQHKYLLDLLQEAEIQDSKPSCTPLDSKLKLDIADELLSNITHYQRLVGKLICLTITIANIT